MKIGPLDTKPTAVPAASERKAQAAPAHGGAEPSTHVELSSAAKLAGNGSAEASFDSEKVSQVAQAIKDGKFKVNPEAIADKLIANAQEILGKTSR